MRKTTSFDTPHADVTDAPRPSRLTPDRLWLDAEAAALGLTPAGLLLVLRHLWMVELSCSQRRVRTSRYFLAAAEDMEVEEQAEDAREIEELASILGDTKGRAG